METPLSLLPKPNIAVFCDDMSILDTYQALYELTINNFNEIDRLENLMIQSAEYTKIVWSFWKQSLAHNQDLKTLLEAKTEQFMELEKCFNKAMQMVNDEKGRRKCCEQEIDDYKTVLSKLMNQVRKENQNNPSSDTEKLLDKLYPKRKSLEPSFIENKLSTSTSSIDSSYVRFEEELDSSKYLMTGKTWKTVHLSSDAGEPPRKLAGLTSSKLDFNNCALNCNEYLKGNTKVLLF